MAIYDINGLQISSNAFASVIEYGAKGDGTTDDSSAIQDALDALMTSGGTIFFPKGIYLLTTSVLFYSN